MDRGLQTFLWRWLHCHLLVALSLCRARTATMLWRRRCTEYLTCWGPGLLRLGAIMSFGGYCVSRPGLLRLGAVVG